MRLSCATARRPSISCTTLKHVLFFHAHIKRTSIGVRQYHLSCGILRFSTKTTHVLLDGEGWNIKDSTAGAC
jgi:hypothetical protein